MTLSDFELQQSFLTAEPLVYFRLPV